MFNKESLEFGNQPSVIREIFEYSKKRKKEIGENNVFDFSIGNPSVKTPKEYDQTLVDLLSSDTNKIHSYTSNVGDDEVRTLIAKNIKDNYNSQVSKDLIYMMKIYLI